MTTVSITSIILNNKSITPFSLKIRRSSINQAYDKCNYIGFTDKCVPIFSEKSIIYKCLLLN